MVIKPVRLFQRLPISPRRGSQQPRGKRSPDAAIGWNAKEHDAYHRPRAHWSTSGTSRIENHRWHGTEVTRCPRVATLRGPAEPCQGVSSSRPIKLRGVLLGPKHHRSHASAGEEAFRCVPKGGEVMNSRGQTKQNIAGHAHAMREGH